MPQVFINKEISKIMNNEKLDFPLNMAMSSAWIAGNLKGVNLKILNMSKESSLSDYYVLASANNPTQAKSMAETIMRQMRNYNHSPISTEGFNNCEWILLDFGDIMIHIFLEATRGIFDLDSLWRDAPLIEIPQEYYYTDSGEDRDNKDDKGYF